VGLERGLLSLVSTTEELLERKISGSGLEIRDYDRGDLSARVALISSTSGGRSVRIVRSRTKATDFVCLFVN
jgi:hypothetical protein